MRLSLLLPGVAVAGSSLLACAVPAPEPGPESTANTPATAVVEVERTSGPGDSARSDAVVARFVRVKQGAVDDTALRIAGASADLPAPGTCVVPSDSGAVKQGRAVELLDVGQVSMTNEGGARSTLLSPRSMPDPAGVVSGVFYSTRSAEAFGAGSKVALRSTGGPDLGEGFAVSVTAPRELADVRIVPLPNALDVAWDAAEGDARDSIYVDVLSPAPRTVLRCVGTLEGSHLVIPTNLEEGQLGVHRLHRESFRAKGIEPGEVRFDVAKVVTFRR